MNTLRDQDLDDNGTPILDAETLQEEHIEPEIVLDTFQDVELSINLFSSKPVDESVLNKGKVMSQHGMLLLFLTSRIHLRLQQPRNMDIQHIQRYIPRLFMGHQMHHTSRNIT